MDARRVGRAVRALRIRLGWRQADLAAKAKVSQDLVSRLERGRIEGMSMPAVDRVLAALDADLVVLVRWRGGDLDRLLDQEHAAMNEHCSSRLAELGWTVEPEVSYSEFGERGSIDLLAWHVKTRTIAVVEVKTALTSIEETLRRHDAKTRLAPKVSLQRFGWTASFVLRLLILPETTVTRDRVREHAAILERAYPLRGFELRRWLQAPTALETRGGILFLRLNDQARHTRRIGGVKRVRRAVPDQGDDATGSIVRDLPPEAASNSRTGRSQLRNPAYHAPRR